MAIFENTKLNVTVFTCKPDVLDNKPYRVDRIFPMQEYSAFSSDFGKINNPKTYKDLYFVSGENGNSVLKFGNEKCLAFSIHVPSISDTIPIKYIVSNNGTASYEKGEITVVHMIQLSSNCYVINPHTNEELVLVTPEEDSNRRIGY